MSVEAKAPAASLDDYDAFFETDVKDCPVAAADRPKGSIVKTVPDDRLY